MLTLQSTIAERLVHVIRDYISEFRPGFQPGQRLNIQDLATEFGVSATPVKEALKRLEASGLVEVRPRRGAVVTSISLRDVQEIIAVREGLEQLAFRLCDGRADPAIVDELERALAACEAAVAAGDLTRYHREDLRYHRLIVESGGNRRLVAIYRIMLDQLPSAQAYTPRSMRNIEASIREHHQLIEVIRAGSLAAIEHELRAHWVRSKARMLDGYRSYLAESNSEIGTRSQLVLGEGQV